MSEFSTVFVVIPVFNRLHFTRKCLEHLSRQRYPRVVPVVCDGGSTDGTPAAIAREYPAAIVLTSNIELWWAGATAMGVEYALKNGNPDRDFVLFLNNDTEIPEDYITVLVRVARRRNCAVGAKIVDACNPNRCLDGGEYIDWKTYSFPVKTKIAPDELGCDDVDVLPGRGSLVSLSVIVRVGNIAAREFPHYIADYDFFLRTKKAGVSLFVTYETSLMAHIEETGITPAKQPLSWQSARMQLFSRRSMTNVIDHWRFIRKHAPAEVRFRTLVRLIWGAVDVTPLGIVRTILDRDLLAIFSSVIANMRPPWIISVRACSRRGLTIADFASCGLVVRRRAGWLVYHRITLRALLKRWIIPLLVASTWPVPFPRRRARAKLYLLKRGTRSGEPLNGELRGNSHRTVTW